MIRRKHLDYVTLLREEVVQISERLDKNTDSRILFTDKVWKSIPSANRHEIINDTYHFEMVNNFFIQIKERDEILKSIFKIQSQRDITGENVPIQLTELLKSYNNLILSRSKEIINIDWKIYYPHSSANLRPYHTYLIIPLLIVFSLALTYVVECILYVLLVNFSNDELASRWQANILATVFFLISTAVRRSVAFLMLRFIFVRFRLSPASKAPNRLLSNNTQVSKAKLIFCSVAIMGLPSVFLSTVIFSFGEIGEDVSTSDSNTLRLLAFVLIPIFDVLRMILAVLVLKTSDTIRTLYLVAAGATLTSGLIYASMGVNLLQSDPMPFSQVLFGITLICIGILQMGWTVPMVKKSRSQVVPYWDSRTSLDVHYMVDHSA